MIKTYDIEIGTYLKGDKKIVDGVLKSDHDAAIATLADMNDRLAETYNKKRVEAEELSRKLEICKSAIKDILNLDVLDSTVEICNKCLKEIEGE